MMTGACLRTLWHTLCSSCCMYVMSPVTKCWLAWLINVWLTPANHGDLCACDCVSLSLRLSLLTSLFRDLSLSRFVSCILSLSLSTSGAGLPAQGREDSPRHQGQQCVACCKRCSQACRLWRHRAADRLNHQEVTFVLQGMQVEEIFCSPTD